MKDDELLKMIGFKNIKKEYHEYIKVVYDLRVIDFKKAMNFIQILKRKSYLTVYANSIVEDGDNYNLNKKSYIFAIKYCKELREKKIKRILKINKNYE